MRQLVFFSQGYQRLFVAYTCWHLGAACGAPITQLTKLPRKALIHLSTSFNAQLAE